MKMKKFPIFQFYFVTLTAIVPAYFFFKYPFSLGGSIATCSFIIPVLVLLLLQLRELSNIFVMLSIVISGILIINFLSYLENSMAITLSHIIILGNCIFAIAAFFYWISFWPTKLSKPLNDSEKKLMKQIQIILLAPILFIGLPFGVFGSLMVLFISDVEQYLYNNTPFLRGFYMVFAGIVFCFFISYLYLNKISDEDIRTLIAEEKFHLIKYDAKTFKKWYLLIFCAFAIVGSGIEGGRNMWPIWIETILLVGLMSLILWKIYKHLFQTETME